MHLYVCVCGSVPLNVFLFQCVTSGYMNMDRSSGGLVGSLRMNRKSQIVGFIHKKRIKTKYLIKLNNCDKNDLRKSLYDS